MIFVFLFLFFNPNPIENCISLLKSKKYKEAALVFRTIDKNDHSEKYRFLKAYYTRDAALTISTYERLYLESKNEDIRFLATQKLYEYYYSLGYYLKAEKLKRGKNTTRVAVSASGGSERFALQYGVFSSEANARQLKEKIAAMVQNKVYLKRDYLNEKTIFRVYVGDFLSYLSAEKIKMKLKEKHNISGFIRSVGK